MVQESLPLLSIYEGNSSLQPLIARFVTSIKDRLEEFHSSILNRDLEGVKRNSHKFRGSAATFGFPQVAASVRRVEECFIQHLSGQTKPADIVAAFDRLIDQCNRLCTNGSTCKIDSNKLLISIEDFSSDFAPSGDAALALKVSHLHET